MKYLEPFSCDQEFFLLEKSAELTNSRPLVVINGRQYETSIRRFLILSSTKKINASSQLYNSRHVSSTNVVYDETKNDDDDGGF